MENIFLNDLDYISTPYIRLEILLGTLLFLNIFLIFLSFFFYILFKNTFVNKNNFKIWIIKLLIINNFLYLTLGALLFIWKVTKSGSG